MEVVVIVIIITSKINIQVLPLNPKQVNQVHAAQSLPRQLRVEPPTAIPRRNANIPELWALHPGRPALGLPFCPPGLPSQLSPRSFPQYTLRFGGHQDVFQWPEL